MATGMKSGFGERIIDGKEEGRQSQHNCGEIRIEMSMVTSEIVTWRHEVSGYL